VYVEQGVLDDETFLAWREQIDFEDLAPGPGGSRITWLKGMSVVGRLSGRAAMVALYPSSQLVAHCDPPIAGRRFHIPLVVNDGCWVFHAGTWQQLEVGRVYQMDPTEVHGAVNWGTERRVHLMVDTED
jgi:hypothetical protein